MTAFIIAGTLLLLAGAPPSQKEPPKCEPNGRYWVHVGGGEKGYCYDGSGFAASNAPPYVKSHFEPAAAAAGASAGPVPSRAKTVAPAGKSAFTGSPSLPATPSGGGSGGGGTFSMSGGGGGGGGGAKPSALNFENMMNQSGPAGFDDAAGRGTVKRGPLPPEVFRAVSVGMSRTEVQAKLGLPHGRILNSGDDATYEIWTYLTRDGNSASLRISDGVVVAVRLPY